MRARANLCVWVCVCVRERETLKGDIERWVRMIAIVRRILKCVREREGKRERRKNTLQILALRPKARDCLFD